jgi:hypothetical protein
VVAVEAEDRGLGLGSRRGKVVLHEEAGVNGEALLQEGLFEVAGVVEQELGFDAIDIGGVLEKLEQAMEKQLRGLEGLGDIVREGVDVADDGLMAFVDAEGVAAYASTVEGDEAGQDARVEVLEQELGGGLVVPTETSLPEASLVFEQRAQLTRGVVPKVEDLELGRGDHKLGKVFVELIGIRAAEVERGTRGVYPDVLIQGRA